MPASRVKISYSAPVNFLASDQWIQIRTAFDTHLPLRNLHWKSSTDEAIRTIHELEVDLISLDSIKDESSSQVPTSLLEKPFLNLYIFPCEDAEQYRTSYKKQVKDWQAIVSNKRHQDWLVILVVRPESKPTGSSRIFSMRAPAMDKVKADINITKRDRCVELTWPVGQDDSAAWTELISKVKDGILATFDAYVATREEEIQRSESQRSLPGWNFCTFFILKESLASTFDGMNILEEAYDQYEALERSFFQALDEKNLQWFGNVGGNAPGDDSRSVLDLTHKAYRELIVSNTVTLFDFRIYLFACKMHLLAKQHRLLDVIERSHLFIVSFARTLRENERTLTAFFLESWIYSSAMNVIEQCDRWLAKSKHREDASYKTRMSAKKGELMNLARGQLDKIGIHRGFLPNKTPFSLSWHSSHPPQPWFTAGEDVNSKITRAELIEVLNDQAGFDSLYISTTQRAIEYYAEGKRRKFALKLHGDLAAFDSHRGNFPTAHQTFASLPAHYTSNKHKWPPLEAFMIARALDTHSRLEKEKDEQWLEAALSFLGICSQAAGRNDTDDKEDTGTISMALLDDKGSPISDEQRRQYLEGLIKDVQAYASGLTEEVVKLDHPSFSIELLNPDATLAEKEDGSFVETQLRNNLICGVSFDRIEVEITDHDDESFSYSKQNIFCPPGMNPLSLFCPDVHSGVFSVTSVSVWWEKIRLKHVFGSSDGKSQGVPQSPTPTPGTGKHPVPIRQDAPIIRIPTDPHSLDIKMALPETIKWDAPPSALFLLRTGRNNIEEALVSFTAAGGVTFQLSEAELEDDTDVMSFEITDEGILLKSLIAGVTVPFTVTHSAPPAGSLLITQITISYQVLSYPPQPRRSLKVIRRLSTALPIQVSVMDSFRNKSLFSKFTISSTSHLQVRIRDTKLEGGTGLNITAPRFNGRTPAMIVTPQRSVHFLYQLRSEEPRFERETLYLHITYRTMREEIETRLQKELQELLSKKPDLVEEVKIMMVTALAADASWVEPYLFAGELSIPGLDLGSVDGELGNAIKGALATLEKTPVGTKDGDDEDETWQKLIIPVDLPFMHIVFKIQTRLIQDVDEPVRAIYAGQPVPLRLEITSSFHWGAVHSISSQVSEYKMRYVVQEAVADWLVSGHKRGDFTSKDEDTHSFELTLIPLHHGELPLPSITISPISTPTARGTGMENESIGIPSTETYHAQAAERVMVLPRGGRSTFIVGMGGDD